MSLVNVLFGLWSHRSSNIFFLQKVPCDVGLCLIQPFHVSFTSPSCFNIVLYGILSIIRTSEIHLFYNLQVFYWHFIYVLINMSFSYNNIFIFLAKICFIFLFYLSFKKFQYLLFIYNYILRFVNIKKIVKNY